MHTIQQGNTLLIGDRLEKNVLVLPSKFRQWEIRVPYLFKGRPVLTITLSAEGLWPNITPEEQIINDKEPADPLVLYSVEGGKTEGANPSTGETIFKVTAYNMGYNESSRKYYCDFTMMGELLE
jgi:hypothetical protein